MAIYQCRFRCNICHQIVIAEDDYAVLDRVGLVLMRAATFHDTRSSHKKQAMMVNAVRGSTTDRSWGFPSGRVRTFLGVSEKSACGGIDIKTLPDGEEDKVARMCGGSVGGVDEEGD
jgi:hypothetical protein